MAFHKHIAKPTIVDGIRFASIKESVRYGELKNLQRAGVISGLELQPVFAIAINGKHCFKYLADFAYVQGGERVVEDVKSSFTAKDDVYRLKKKCVEAAYSISIREIGIRKKRDLTDELKSREIQQVFKEESRRRG